MKILFKKTAAILLSISLICGMSTVTVKPTAAEAAAAEEINEDSAVSMSVTAENGNTYALNHSYVTPGDVLKVTENGAEYNSDVEWTVKQLQSGTLYETLTSKKSASLEITDEYLESLIYASVEGVTLTIYCSKTPVMYINSDTSYYDVSEDYTNKSTTSIHLVGNDTYSDEKYWYDGKAQIKLRGNSTAYRPKRPFKVKLDSKADLLGLGMENEDGEQKSYKSKHWVLLANDIDHSLLRNKLLYDFSGDIGTEYYFHSTNVTLIYNGQYQGVYQLCEHRRVDEGRIDITNWTAIGENIADTIGKAVSEEYAWDDKTKKSFISELETKMASDYSWMDEKKVTYTGALFDNKEKTFDFADYGITLPSTNGGYLAEMDFYSVGDNTLAGIMTNYKQPLYFSAPEPGEDATDDSEKTKIVNSFKTTSLYKYAKKYTQTFEYALHSDDFIFKNSDSKYATSQEGFYDWWSNKWSGSSYKKTTYTDDENDGKHYSELFDMDSLVTNFLFCEYAMNWDSMKNSFFYYKDVDELAKIGPQWDFDWAWGNTNMYNINTNYPTSWQTTLEYFTREWYYQTVQWNRMLIRDPYFLTLAYEKYQNVVRPVIENMVKDGGLIDQYSTYLKEAGTMNDRRWSYTYTPENYSGATPENFTDSVATIKKFLSKRVKWLDKQFTSVSTLVNSLGYYKKSSDIQISGKEDGDRITFTAVTSNSSAAKIRFQINGKTCLTADVSGGKASVSIEKNVLRSDGLNTVVANEVNQKGNYIYNTSASKTGNYNVVKSDYLVLDLNHLDELPKEDDSLLSQTVSTPLPTATVSPSASENPSADGTSDSETTKSTTKAKVSKVTIKVSGKKGTIKKLSLKKGKKIKLKAVVKGSGAFKTGVTWKSSKKKTASVTKKGVVTGKRAGTVKITAISVGDKTKKAVVTVKVK